MICYLGFRLTSLILKTKMLQDRDIYFIILSIVRSFFGCFRDLDWHLMDINSS